MPANRKNISETHHNRYHASPTGFGIVTYRKGSRLGPRRQMDYQLVVIHRGKVTLSIDGIERYLSPGQGILLRPGGEEIFRFATDEETMHSWCQIPRHVVPPRMEFPEEMIGWPADCDPWLLGFMKEAWKMPGDASTTAGRQMIISAVLMAMWAFCRARPEVSATARPWPEPLLKARKFMEAHLADPLTLEDIARVAGVSIGHLIKLAKVHWDMTPMERLWQERVEAGARLLKETGLGIGEIAYRTGFSNPFHFSRRFRQRYAQHPRAWRQGAWGYLGDGPATAPKINRAGIRPSQA